MPTLNGSWPLLSCAPPAVLDLDQLGTGCNLAVDVSGELDLIAGSGEALCGIWANCKSFLAAPCRRAPRVRALSCQWFKALALYTCCFPNEAVSFFLVGNPMEKRSALNHMKQKKDVQQGTLALMVLKTLDVLGPLHGYAVARRIEQISGDLLSVNQGTLYPVLLRLEQEGAITSDWATSENNRRARFYRLTRMGHKLLESEKRDWEETGAIIARFFEVKAEDLA